MKKYDCIACENETNIKLMPDYSSDHVWCGSCGCGFNINELEMPNYIKVLINQWGLLWDVVTLNKTGIDENCFEKYHMEAGHEIQKQLSKYYDCFLAEHKIYWLYRER